MMLRIVALAVAGLLATAVPAGATPAQTGPIGAGPHPPGPTDPPGGPTGTDAWAWTQLTSRGTQIRYVTNDSSQSCPSVRYTYMGSRGSFPLHLVSTPSTSQFPTTVCEVGVPLTASNAVLELTTVHADTLHPASGQLPLPRWTATTRPSRIAVIGDTGCSVPVTGPVQDCANGWPFEQIANRVTDRTRPDLVIHTGDYLYREDPSRENDQVQNPGCTNRAEAASWDCVVADFFRPAERLLAAAPVALARGNHEDCNPGLQGGAGGAWFRYLADDLRNDGRCTLFSPVALLRAGTLTLANVDSSFADPADNGGTANQSVFTRQFDAVNQAAAQHPHDDYFVLTHKPLWMVKAAGFTPGAVTWVTPVLDRAVAGTHLQRLADNVRLALSGHIHLYQMLDFNTARPPQLTVGSAGGPLDDGPDDSNVERQSIGTPPQQVHQSITQLQNPGGAGVFGFADLRYDGTTWGLAFRDRTGAVRGRTCTLSTSTANKTFTCH
ncbi:metallophosphoesterase family protein [Streptomyces sp. NPDC059851]|uniref:metallophosphoesterase family protein n=1 Tax=Streptomyces sp. NPDC059851 TaxID=3346971 RepID=UPI0036696DE9